MLRRNVILNTKMKLLLFIVVILVAFLALRSKLQNQKGLVTKKATLEKGTSGIINNVFADKLVFLYSEENSLGLMIDGEKFLIEEGSSKGVQDMLETSRNDFRNIKQNKLTTNMVSFRDGRAFIMLRAWGAIDRSQREASVKVDRLKKLDPPKQQIFIKKEASKASSKTQ